MRKMNWAASAAIVSLTLAAGSAYADSTPATMIGCLDLGKQVKAALAANVSSPNYFTANQEYSNGQSFCNATFYQRGIDRYNHALELLGAGK